MNPFKPDTDSFYRLLASLGVLVLILAATGPLLFFRDLGALRVSERELRGLTATSRQVIRDRQASIADLQAAVPWIMGTAAAAGLLLLVVGARGMRHMQGLELRTATATLKDLELRLNTQSVDQQKKRAEEEADTVRALDSAETHNESASSGPSANDYFDIESRVLKALERPPSTGLRFRPRVEIRAHESDVAPLLLDGLYICAPPADRDVIVEIKVAESGLAFRNAAEQLLASVTRYEDISGRPARGWLIGITNLAQRSRRERDVRALLGGRGSVNLLPVEDLDALELIAVPH